MAGDIKAHPALLSLFASRLPGLHKRDPGYWAKCIFHNENTPSLNVGKDEHGQWCFHCFGCGEGGDTIAFIQKADKISFNKAKKIVEQATGGDWEQTKQKADATFSKLELESTAAKTYPLKEYVKFEIALYESQEAKEWLFTERGITYDTARQLHFGYCPNISCLNKQVRPELQDISDKGWIITPAVEKDEVVCIEARSMARKAFSRKTGMNNRVLFGTDFISWDEPVYVVEGHFDQAIMLQAGYRCVTLPSSTYQLTPEQRDLLMGASVVILAGDNDGGSGTAAMIKLWNELQERTYRLVWPKGMKDANDTYLKQCSRDITAFQNLVDSLTLGAYGNPIPGVKSIQDILKHDDSEKAEDRPDRFRFGISAVDKMTNILPGSVVYVSATQTSTGKALANGTQVFTPNGLVNIENLHTGMSVYGSNGKETKVVGVYPQGLRDCVRVRLSDGTSVVCDRDHLWTVTTINNLRDKKYITKTTQYLIDHNGDWKNGNKWILPTTEPVEFLEKELKLDPYLLGVLLGDGCITKGTPQLSSEDPEIIEEVSKCLPINCGIKEAKSKDRCRRYLVTGPGKGRKNPVIEALKELKLQGLTSRGKYIPFAYLYASSAQRLRILQGLMDTDGYVEKNGSTSFATSSHQLALDVAFLVRSLGGFATITYRKATDSWLVWINSSVNCFLLPRKAERYKKRSGRGRLRRIESFEVVGIWQSTCIKVEAENGLFLIDDFIVTHNTQFTLQETLNAARKNDEIVLNYQTEMQDTEIGEIVTANLLAKERNDIGREDRLEAAKRLKGCSYYIGNNPNLNSASDVLDLIEAGIRRIGATVVVLDHIHFICRNEKDEIKAQSQAMQRIKRMAQKYLLKFFVVGQPRKPGQKTQGKPIDIYDAKGSEAIVSDSDVVFFLHRDVIKNLTEESADNLSPEVQVRCMKGRSRGKGAAMCKLFFIGKIATFREIVNIEEPVIPISNAFDF